MVDNIIQMPEPLKSLAEDIRAAYRQRDRGRDEWIEGTIKLALKLREARDRFSSDNAFGHWLVDNDLNKIGDNSRAALINMAVEPERLRDALIEQEDELEPITIWRKVKDRFGQLSKPFDLSLVKQIPVAIEAKSVSSETDEAKIAVAVPKKVDVRHSFYGRERADEVLAVYQNRQMHGRIGAVLAKKEGARVWALILKALDAGFLTANTACPAELNLAALFPHTPLGFRQSRRLGDRTDLKIIEDQIMPAALANRDAIVADPGRIEQIIKDHAARLQQVAMAEQQNQKLAAAKMAMKASEHEVVLFGKVFWPLVDWDPLLAYDFEMLRSAVWIFREMHQIARSTSDPSPKSSALHIRHIIKFMWRYADKNMQKVLLIIVELSRAMEKHGHDDPNARPPTMPIVDRPYE